MEIRKRGHLILIVCIVAIAVVAVAEIVYIHMNELSEPVFLESYIEVSLPEVRLYDSEKNAQVSLREDGLYYLLDEGEDTTNVGIAPGSDRLEQQLEGDCQFELKYVTNINDPIQVANIVFDEAPQLNIYVSENPDENWSGGFYQESNENENGIQCGRYAVRTMYVTIHCDEEQELFMDLIRNDKFLELHHATITTYINGKEAKEQKVNLGSIILTPAKSAEDILQSIYSGGTNDDTRQISTEKYKLKKAVRIVSVESPLLGQMPDSIGVNIEGSDYTEATGLQFAKGDVLTIESWCSQTKSAEQSCSDFMLLPVVTFKDEEGNLYEEQIFNVNYSNINCVYTSKGIRQYLKERGVI